jgi:hypothetical protein
LRSLCLICAEKVMQWMVPADAAAHYEEYRRYTQELRAGGHLVDVNRLLPPDAAVQPAVGGQHAGVRHRRDETRIGAVQPAGLLARKLQHGGLVDVLRRQILHRIRSSRLQRALRTAAPESAGAIRFRHFAPGAPARRLKTWATVPPARP